LDLTGRGCGDRACWVVVQEQLPVVVDLVWPVD
jgi:hypothetical protein